MEWLTQNWPHITSNVIAAAALVFSALAFRESKRRRELSEKIESARQRDAQRAGLRCVFERITTSGHFQFSFVLCNDGPAAASEIKVELDGKAISEHEGLVVDPEVPSELASGEKFPCCQLARLGDRNGHTGKLRWKDGSGELQEQPISFRPW